MVHGGRCGEPREMKLQVRLGLCYGFSTDHAGRPGTRSSLDIFRLVVRHPVLFDGGECLAPKDRIVGLALGREYHLGLGLSREGKVAIEMTATRGNERAREGEQSSALVNPVP